MSNLLESDVDWDEESVRDELRAIVGDVARLNSSIGALLELSRLEAHAWEPRRELYGLGEIVEAGIDTLPAHLRERVQVQLPEQELVVDVDFVQFTRVIQNLLENAMLYTDGPVTVGARGWNDGVRLWVEDQGQGIPADEHEAVFEKFFRGRRSGPARALGHRARPGDHPRDRAQPRRHDHRGRRGAARGAVRDHADRGRRCRSGPKQEEDA